MIIKQEINQTMRQKYSIENCKKQYVVWINGSNMNWGMNIRDKLSYIEAQYKIPLHNQRYEKGYLKEKLKIQSSSSKHLPFVIIPRSFLRPITAQTPDSCRNSLKSLRGHSYIT